MGTKKKIGFIVSTLTAFTLLLSGCGKETGWQATQDSKSKPAELNVGYADSLGTQLGFIAEYKDFFKQENLKVNFVPFASTADGLNALQAGKIDLGVSFGTAGPLTFISKGSDFSIIGGHLSGGSPIFARPENGEKYKSVEDFKGKKIGTIRLYTGDIVFRSALAQTGLDWKKDVEITEFKNPPALIEAVKSGKVDVGIGTPPNLASAKEAGLVVVKWSNDLNPSHVCCRVVTRGATLNDKEDAYVRFLKAMIKAERVKEETPEVTVTASKPHLKMDDQHIKDVTLEPHQINQVDPNKKEVINTWNEMKKIGYIDNNSNVDINKNINVELYGKALNQLLVENPNDPFYKKLQDRYAQQDL